MKKFIFTLMMLMSYSQAQAAIEIYQFEQAQHEALYKIMIEELRCLVCQNQNLSASNSALARDLRKQTYLMVSEGKTRDEIVAYMTQRYGDFVLYRPPFKVSTFLLWFGPACLLLIACMSLINTVKQNRQQRSDLSQQEQQQIKQLLSEGEQ